MLIFDIVDAKATPVSVVTDEKNFHAKLNGETPDAVRALLAHLILRFDNLITDF